MQQKACVGLLAWCVFVSTATAGVEQTVNDLIPKLASAKAEERYAPQMELQSLAAHAARPGAEAERAALAKTLAARAVDPAVPQPARVWLVRQLEHMGAAEAVPALTALLKGPEAELRECARRALEKNSAPAASKSLQAALKRGGEPAWSIGLIQSLGERGDTKAAALIAQRLKAPETALAAAAALAKIGSEPAIKELWAAFEKKSPPAAAALVTAADRLAARGESKRARALYARLYTACAGTQIQAAALAGLAQTEPEGARALVIDALLGNEPKLQQVALTVAPEIFGGDLSATLAGLLPKAGTSARLQMLRAVDGSVEKEVVAAAGDSDPAVCAAAYEALGRMGGALSVPVLLKAAAGEPSAVQKAAAQALSRVSGSGADAAIAKLAAQGEAKGRIVAIKALADRRDKAALPMLLQYAAEPDRAVSGAACAALGTMGADPELDGLLRLALAGKAPGADAALQAVAGRAQNKAEASRKLLALLGTAQPQQSGLLFDTLAMLGSQDAMEALCQYASGANEDAKDAAIRALANWPDFSASRPLLAIAADPEAKRVHRVLAVQAVARLVKSSDKEPADARLDAALAAMKAASRGEEKKLLLSAIASVPNAKAAEALKPYLSEPQLKTEAGLAAVTLAEALAKSDLPAAKDLAQAAKDAGLSAETGKKADKILRK